MADLGIVGIRCSVDNYGMDADLPESASKAQRARILLADDSDVERLALAHFLRRAGYEVRECADGKTTIEHLRSGDIDLLLLDLQMPGVDGFDVLNYVDSHCRRLPVILLSGMPVDVIQLKMGGLTSRELPPLFLKPVDLDQLIEVLELRLTGVLPDLKTETGNVEQ